VPLQTFGGEGTLLRRAHGRVFVTEAGQLFLASCEAILSVASEACRAIQDYRCACWRTAALHSRAA